jgi:hypothetical protein
MTDRELLERLRMRAKDIDRRLGPIPGPTADRIAEELRTAAEVIERLLGEGAPR